MTVLWRLDHVVRMALRQLPARGACCSAPGVLREILVKVRQGESTEQPWFYELGQMVEILGRPPSTGEAGTHEPAVAARVPLMASSCVLIVPIVAAGGTAGALGVGNPKDTQWSRIDLGRLCELARFAAACIDRAAMAGRDGTAASRRRSA